MIAGLISNGYYFTPDRIKRLNEAGLEYLQISIDNVEPDEVSRKSLRVLDKKLRYLSEHADFHININSVIGGGIKNPEDALTVARTRGGAWLLDDGRRDSRRRRNAKAADSRKRRNLPAVKKLGNKDHARLNWFQDSIAEGKPYEWRCRSGSRYLYICEDGKVHWCSQQRGYPGIPLEEYTMEDFKREYKTEKWCAPTCTHSVRAPGRHSRQLARPADVCSRSEKRTAEEKRRADGADPHAAVDPVTTTSAASC